MKANLKRTATTREVNAAARNVLRKKPKTLTALVEKVFDESTETGIEFNRLFKAAERIGGVGL